MKPFWKAILSSLRYKWSIAGAILSSMLIAILWSASISTMYPFVEVILSQKNAHMWVNDEIQKIDARVENFQKEMSSLQVTEPRDLRKEDLLASRIQAESTAKSWFLNVKPWIDEYAPESPFETLIWALGWLLATSILKGILLVISSILVAKVANRTVMDMRRNYYRQALKMDQRRIDNYGTSNLMTHLSHNMLMVSGGLQVFYGKMVREPLKMIVCMIGAAYISWQLLIISLLVVPFGAYVVHSLSSRMKRSTQREMEGMGAVFQTLIETFGSIKTVRVFNRELTERRRFKRNSGSLYRISVRISLYDSLLRPFTEMLGIISISLSVLVGAYLVIYDATEIFNIPICNRPLSPSSLLLFYTLLAGASDPARKMTEVLNILVRGGTACENLVKVFDAPINVAQSVEVKSVPSFQKSIKFEKVLFAYRANQPVLKNVSFEIPKGQVLAIVGGNGCGKSTIVNLLLRFYDPNRGEILLDGSNIREMNPRKIRRLMAWVTQDSQLFSGTIRENIAYGNIKANEDEIRAAAKMALVSEFVDCMPDGLDTEIGDDGRLLSAGQRQRVALARAILAKPEILILDEATSQIDGKTETKLHASLADFIKSRTTIIITHRASSLKLADRVLVMESGRIVADCPADEVAQASLEFQFLFAKSA